MGNGSLSCLLLFSLRIVKDCGEHKKWGAGKRAVDCGGARLNNNLPTGREIAGKGGGPVFRVQPGYTGIGKSGTWPCFFFALTKLFKTRVAVLPAFSPLIFW